MKSTGQKLKKLKTRQVYGFKKELVSIGGITDTTTIVTYTHMMMNAVN
ncbi:hypothetical protein [Mucilaginibacter sp.]|nr:hypothetical protein [Mucilaginibacter sp.]MDR3696105.1 hypothetical protein [Mucilaginibacter sp.]